MFGSMICPSAGKLTQDRTAMIANRLRRIGRSPALAAGSLVRWDRFSLSTTVVAVFLVFGTSHSRAQSSGVDPNIGARIDQSLPTPADQLLNSSQSTSVSRKSTKPRLRHPRHQK